MAKQTLYGESVKASDLFAREVRQTHSASAGARKVSKEIHLARNVVVVAPQKPALCAHMLDTWDQATLNITESVFEAKGGFRAAVLAVSSNEGFRKIEAAPMIKKSLGKIGKEIAKGRSGVVEMLDGGTAAMKRFENDIVNLNLNGAELRTKMPLPKAAWSSRIFGFECWGAGVYDANVTWPNYGLMQVIVVLSGTVAFAGFRIYFKIKR